METTSVPVSGRSQRGPSERPVMGKRVLDEAPFTVHVVDLGDRLYLMHVRGDLDMPAADNAWQRADNLLTPGAALIIDLSRLNLADSSALRFLLLARREAERRGAKLRLTGLRPWLRERLRQGGVLHLFDIRPNLAAALEPPGFKAAAPPDR